MAKVVGVSGAQGAGKSTLLVELKSRGWIVDDFKVSRAVQSQLGWETLDRVMDSPATMMEFQRAVLKQKLEREQYLMEQPEKVILTERTFADVCAYSMNWGWKFAELGSWDQSDAYDWATAMTRRCFENQKLYAGVVLLPFMKDVVAWQEDPNRAPLHTIDAIFEDIDRFMQSRACFGIKCLTVTAKTVSDRASQVELFLNAL